MRKNSKVKLTKVAPDSYEFGVYTRAMDFIVPLEGRNALVDEYNKLAHETGNICGDIYVIFDVYISDGIIEYKVHDASVYWVHEDSIILSAMIGRDKLMEMFRTMLGI